MYFLEEISNLDHLAKIVYRIDEHQYNIKDKHGHPVGRRNPPPDLPQKNNTGRI